MKRPAAGPRIMLLAVATGVAMSIIITHAAPPDLSAAKALYASASYEDALAALAKITDDEDVQLVEQYRALCLLALGRTSEARQSLERMVTMQPTYTITDADVSPRLVAMFHEVRKQLLPAAARKTYSTAKASFESKNYVAASAQFKAMFAILDDPDMADQASSLADLKMLGEGFVALSESQIASAAKPAAPPASAPPAAAAPAPNAPPASPAPAPPSNSAGRIYTSFDKEVIPPVEVDRRMPSWLPANAVEQRTIYNGLIVVVIDEKGAVESVALQKSALPRYDTLLLQAAKAWQFRPARLNGKPVKYSKTYEVALRAR